MSVAGTYECVTKSPMGDQKSTFTVNVAGDTFTGSNSGPMGTAEVSDGKVDGNSITWTIKLTSPMPMTLEGSATVDGDDFNGQVKAGAFGTFPMVGKRVA
ncbi:hypothetical protein OLX02_11335 [Novosphingobium sp. KCTC 2891]|uniref:hypothetical protein n=1 Tax=Novosphingobium sp. KCTC 2891 TaxID=2989730 RepID=UPI002221A902|nr:hypothetical protein [Novosphingobium sp. KCTC 2891]MCW1383413.1 hypothetical protein [Novosphingobium sp. KCTC 2891]